MIEPYRKSVSRDGKYLLLLEVGRHRDEVSRIVIKENKKDGERVIVAESSLTGNLVVIFDFLKMTPVRVWEAFGGDE